MVADAPADAGKWVIFFDDPQSLFVSPFPDHGDVPLGTLSRRAGIPARSHPFLFDGVSIRDGLGVQLVGRLALAQTAVEGVRQSHRAGR